MDAAQLIFVGIGGLIGVGAVVVLMIRSKAVNREDALQRRLAGHIETYARSVKDDEAGARLKADLKAELKARSVPQEEWSFRIVSAGSLVDPVLQRQHTDAIIAALTRLKLIS